MGHKDILSKLWKSVKNYALIWTTWASLRQFSNFFSIKLIPTWDIFPFSDSPTVLLLTCLSRSSDYAVFRTTTNPEVNFLGFFFFSRPCKIPLQITFIPPSLIKIIFLAKLALVKNTEFCYKVQSVPCLSQTEKRRPVSTIRLHNKIFRFLKKKKIMIEEHTTTHSHAPEKWPKWSPLKMVCCK